MDSRTTRSAATRLGGELMDMPLGQIRAGMLVDLLVVDGDPVAYIGILQGKTRIPDVMKDGSFHRCLLA